MSDVWTQIDAIEADETLSAEQKRLARYELKAWAIADIINNGKPPPNPVPPQIGVTNRLDGVDYTIFFAAQEVRNGVPVLRIIMLAKRVSPPATLISPQDDLIFVNPPSLTRTRNKDLAAAAREMLASLIP